MATKANPTVDEAYSTLCKLLNKEPRDAQRKVVDHIRAVTGKPMISLPVYHQSDASEPDKLKMYQECGLAVLTKNYNNLRKETPAPVIEVAAKRVDPLDEAIPERPVVAPVLPVVAPLPPESPAPRFETEAHKSQPDSLSAAIEALMEKAIAKYDAGFHDRVKAALGNGSFPTERINELVDKAVQSRLGLRDDRYELHDPPVTDLQGLQNQVMQIANLLSSGQTKEAQLQIIDLINGIMTKSARHPVEYKVVALRECPTDSPKVDQPELAEKYWREHVESDPRFCPEQEQFVVLMLNTRRNVKGHQVVALGTLDTINVHARETFRAAIISASAAIIVMHNHPSGDPTPSEADIKVTRDLIRAGQLLKMELLDHVVIGKATVERPKGYSSLRELGYFWN